MNTHILTLIICRKFYNIHSICFLTCLPTSPSITICWDSATHVPVFQAWLFSDHLIQQQGKCLTVSSTSVTPGSLVLLQGCNPREGRQVSLLTPGVAQTGCELLAGEPWVVTDGLK